MLPYFHILFGFIFSLSIYFLFKFNFIGFLVLFFSTWVFDVDHYLFFVFKKNKLNFFEAYKYFMKKKNLKLPVEQRKREMIKENRLFIFHQIEIICLIFLASFFILKFFKAEIYSILFLVGIFFHTFLDLLESLKEGFIAERYSLILFYISKIKLKKD